MVEQEPKTKITRENYEVIVDKGMSVLLEGWTELGLKIKPGVDRAHFHGKAENALRDMLNSVAEVVEENSR